MRLRDLGVLAVLLTSQAGCAAVFRSSREDVSFVSMPAVAEVELQEGRTKHVLQTPGTARVARDRATHVTVRSPGHKTHRGYIAKTTNVGWVILDTMTCVIPVALCIPLVVDALTGAWVDVSESYERRLEPGEDPLPAPAPATTPVAPGAAPPEGEPSTGPDIRI